MCNKRRQLTKRWWCRLKGDHAATGGGGSMRGGGTGRQAAKQQPDKQEWLNWRQSQQTGMYTTTI
jgi:hypothetical protein